MSNETIKSIQEEYLRACNQTTPSLQGFAADVCGQEKTYRPPTLREEHEKSLGFHREQADKDDQAAAFFREYPTFDLFVRLVRAGIIRI